MRSLRDVQNEFSGSLLAPGRAAARQRGIHIYIGNVHGNWEKALASAYPIVRKLVGESFFEGLARAYAAAHPSVSGDLNEFGSDFPAFVSHCPDTLDVPYLPAVARMEWLAHLAHFAADPPAFDPARLAGMAPEEHAALPLRLAPASSLLASAWPLARIWEIHQEGYTGEIGVDFASAPGHILVYRRAWKVTVELLPHGDYRFLAAALGGATLGAALETAAMADAHFDGAGALARWVGKGAVVL